MSISSERIARFKSHLRDHGYLYLNDVEPGLDHLDLAQEFGKLIPQYDGRLVWSIKAHAQFDDKYHSLNTKKLSPHTECYEFSTLPPKYLVLWCRRAPRCGGGRTTLFDGLKFFDSLDPAERAVLSESRFTFCSSSGIQSSALGRTAVNKILDAHDGMPILRFSYNCIDWGGNHKAYELATALVETFERECMSFEWQENAFLIWDNHRMLHSRTAFQDRGRELARVWLSKRLQ